MTLEDHIAEQRKVVERIAKNMGVTLTPEDWAALESLIHNHAREMFRIAQRYLELSGKLPRE